MSKEIKDKTQKKEDNIIVRAFKSLIGDINDDIDRKKELRQKYKEEMHQYKLDSIKEKVKTDAAKPSLTQQIMDKTIMKKVEEPGKPKKQIGSFFYE